MRFTTPKQAAAFLKKTDFTAIVMHRLPDCDTIGAAAALQLALSAQGTVCHLLCKDEIPALYREIFGEIQVYPPGESIPFHRQIVSVDIASPALFGKGMEDCAKLTSLSIDHHASHTPFAQNTLVLPNAAATCEILFDILCEMGVRITPQIATCLYCGIATDTGCFRHSNVTAHTLEVTAKLLRLGADAAKVNYLLFDTKSKEKLALEQYIFSHLETHFKDRCGLFVLPEAFIRKTGAKEADLNDLVNLAKVQRGIMIAIMLRETDRNVYKVSVRTTAQSGISAAEICQTLGGGGHARAAGCTIKADRRTAKRMILNATVQTVLTRRKHTR